MSKVPRELGSSASVEMPWGTPVIAHICSEIIRREMVLDTCFAFGYFGTEVISCHHSWSGMEMSAGGSGEGGEMEVEWLVSQRDGQVISLSLCPLSGVLLVLENVRSRAWEVEHLMLKVVTASKSRARAIS